LLTLIIIPMVYLWTHRDNDQMTQEAQKIKEDLDRLKASND